MPLLLSESDVRSVLTMPLALEAVETSMRRLADGHATMHIRQRLQTPNRSLLHYMAAADHVSGTMGLKIYTWVGGVLRFLVPLYRAKTGELLALIEADYLGRMRTGAASGIATKYMAREDAHIAAVIGTGGQARTQLEAVAAVRKLSSVRAYGRDPERRARFAQECGEQLGLQVESAPSAEDAVREADIVITATTAAHPVLHGAWIAPGGHINAIGANFPEKRELDNAAVHRAGIIAVDSRQQAMLESGDLIQAIGDDAGRWAVVRELSEIIAGGAKGRTDSRQVTLFKSNGIAIWDIAVATRVFELAVQRGLGQPLALFDSTQPDF